MSQTVRDWCVWAGIVVAACLAPACSTTTTQEVAKERNRPAIVLAAFGTSVAEARAVYDHIDEHMRTAYPDYDLRWAYTSSFIREKLRTQGTMTYSPEEVVDALIAEGYTRAVFQSLHVAPGQEYQEVLDVDTKSLEVAFGPPLLATDGDIDAVINALERHFEDGQPNVVVAHGNGHHPEYNGQLVAFANRMAQRYDHVFTCSVEGQPGTEPLVQAADQAAKAGAVNFVPLMIVAGDHIMNDVMGDEPKSWKNIIGVDEATCAPSLGNNDDVLAIYRSHLDRALASL